jgi:Protein involved in biosynthesis of mitomycin antibiotics/polyketide fumonisin
VTKNSLTPQQVQAYERDGYLYPLTAMSPERAASYLAKLDALQEQYGARAAEILRAKSHLVLTWVNELIRLEPVLDAVESLIGPNIYCWSTSFFMKKPRDPGFVAWHQDGPYSGTPEGAGDIVTAWIALTESNEANGCLKVVAGSHKTLYEHVYKEGTANLLSLSQEIAVEVDESQATKLVLAPGQFSFHHEKIVHGSAPNTSDNRRVGIAVRYMAPFQRKTPNTIDHATLVRGSDPYDTFIQDPVPRADMDPEAVAYLDSVLIKKFGSRYRRGVDAPAKN